MYTANSAKELKKLLKNNNFPILTTDPKTIKTILYMDALKARNNKKNAIGIAPGWVILGIGIIAITAISIYALYKDKNIKVTYEKGKVTLETN